MLIRCFCLVVLAQAMSLVAIADSGTWLYREGVGTSPANPAIWTDSANWVDGILPDGVGATADFRAGDPSATVWVRIPDDQTVTLTYIEASTKNAQFRVIGGTIQVVKNTSGSDKDPRFRINNNNGVNDSPKMTVYSDIVCQGANNLRLNVFSLGGALRFDPEASLTTTYVPLFYMDRYAESGEERRNVFGTLKRLQLSNTMVVQVPGLTEDTTGVWRARPGSRLLERVSGMAGFGLQPGQHVSGEGIAAGSYIKYIYEDDFIELDTAPSVDEVTELACNFARHAPKLSHTFDYVEASDNGQIQTGRTTAENEFTVTINELRSTVAGGSKLTHDYKGSLYYSNQNTIDAFPRPGVIEVRDISLYDGEFQTRGSHFRFLPPTEGATETTLNALGNNSTSPAFTRGRIDVVEGLTLTINDVTRWDGYYYKAGAGTAIFKTSLGAMSLFRVEGGVAVLDPSDPSARISMLTVQNGATFRLAEGRKLNAVGLKVNAGATLEYDDASGLTWDEITVEPGAIIKIGEGKTLLFNAETFPAGTIFAGPGALTGFPRDLVNAYRFEGGIQFAAGGPLEDMILAPVGADLPTRVAPAFWVSVKDPDSIVQDTNGTVVRWNDCRGGVDEGYHFATNSGTLSLSQGIYPRFNGACIQMRHNNDALKTPASVAETPSLVWDTPITGIKSVFVIMHNGYDNQNGGGALLGSTERLATCDFARNGWNGWYGDRFDKNLASPNVLNAPFYLNGRLPPAEIHDGASVYRNVMMTFANAEQLVECHPLGEGASADCWGYQNAIKAGYGAWLGECLIYTEELTREEQMQVTNYLMMKWFGSKMMFTPQVPSAQDLKTLGNSSVEIDVGEAARSDSVKATGTLTKTGGGTLYLEDVQTTALDVQGGEVVITSYDATDPANLPQGAVLHLDATDDASFVGLTEEAGVEQVDTWYDTDSPETAPIHLYRHSAAQKKPTRIVESTAFVRPMKVVDYGPLKTSFDDGAKKAASGWWFSAEDCCAHAFTRDGNAVAGISNVTAVAGIWGSKYGGNQILGGWHQLGDGLRRVMTNNVCLAENIAVPLIGKVYTGKRWDGPTDLAYDTFAMKNGEEVTAGEVGLSGTWDAVSFRVDYAAKVIGSSLGGLGARAQVGGLQVGELFVFTNDVTEAEIRRVDAYLNHKWFGRPVPSRYSPAEAGTLTVAKGAKVTVQGGAPVKVSSLAGGGTIEGSVAFTDGTPVIDVVVDADGLIDGPTLVSTQTFTGGTIRLSGAVSRLQGGRVDVLRAPGIVQDGDWTLEWPAGQLDSRVSLKVSEGHVCLSVAKGLMLIVR